MYILQILLYMVQTQTKSDAELAYRQPLFLFPVAAARVWMFYRNTFGTCLLFLSSAEN